MTDYEVTCPCGLTATGPDCEGLAQILAAHTCPLPRKPRWWESAEWGVAVWAIPVGIIASALLAAAITGHWS